MDDQLALLGGHHGSVACNCHQPCRQSIYSVTYSPARWPSDSLQIQFGCNGTSAECTKHYRYITNKSIKRFYCRENAAMIEVFYEQLNFEMLTESEAYGVSYEK